MLAWHMGFHDVRSKAVAYVPGTITGIVIIMTSLMMVRNASLYVTIMKDDFNQPIMPLLIRILWGFLALLSLWIVIVVGLRTLGLLIRATDNSRGLPDVLSLRSGSLALATLGAAFLAIAGPAFASVATDTYLLRRFDDRHADDAWHCHRHNGRRIVRIHHLGPIGTIDTRANRQRVPEGDQGMASAKTKPCLARGTGRQCQCGPGCIVLRGISRPIASGNSR